MKKQNKINEERAEEKFFLNSEEEKMELLNEAYENMRAVGLTLADDYYHQEELKIFHKLRKKHRMPEISKFLKWKPKLVSQKRFASKIKI